MPVATRINGRSHHVSAHQLPGPGADQVHSWVRIPSSSAPAWGSYFSFLLRSKNQEWHKAVLEFSLSALSGVTDSSSGACGLLPAVFWPTRIDIVIQGQTIQSLYPMAQFLRLGYWAQNDEERLMTDYSMGGLWQTPSTLVTKAASAGLWYLPLKCFWNAASFPSLFQNTDCEVRVYLDTLTNNLVSATGLAITGTPVCNINSAQLLLNVTELSAEEANSQVALINRVPHSFAFHDVRPMLVTLQSGITTASIPLTGLTGAMSLIYFTIRSSSPTQNKEFTFNTGLSNFEIVSSTGINVVGGQTIPDQQARYLIYPGQVKTSFPMYTQGAYYYSFSQDPYLSVHDGTDHGTFSFTGSEQLKLTFASATTSTLQVDVFGVARSVVTLGPGGAISKTDQQ